MTRFAPGATVCGVLIAVVVWFAMPFGSQEVHPSATEAAAVLAAEQFVQSAATVRMKETGRTLVALSFPHPPVVVPDPTDPDLWRVAGDATMGRESLSWRLIERWDRNPGFQLKSVEIWSEKVHLPL